MPKTTVKSSYTPDPGAVRHVLDPVFIELPGTLTVAHVPAETQDVSFRVELVENVLRPTAITVSSRTGQEVTSTDLRAVNVQNLWRSAIVQHLEYWRGFHSWENHDGTKVLAESPIQLPDEDLEKLRLRGPERDTLEYVADIYSLGRLLGLAPALYVQQTFAGENLDPLPRTTASKWIKKARDLGMIQEPNVQQFQLLDEADGIRVQHPGQD
ncbi:hypothetical protein J7I84_14625 [Arthrobacter sp. ISL-85]|uniref:hypothetical protein n=1 Tax=Arthrobacter sp. ISL-85 TaxID=2819115 RepID=UPI001BEC4F4D|nr:hypothetical protein [Arthrobacter sp. ISL-85]MBT2567711.1 hypothetical protein [Arthrobacter sp. ISL-85]